MLSHEIMEIFDIINKSTKKITLTSFVSKRQPYQESRIFRNKRKIFPHKNMQLEGQESGPITLLTLHLKAQNCGRPFKNQKGKKKLFFKRKKEVIPFVPAQLCL